MRSPTSRSSRGRLGARSSRPPAATSVAGDDAVGQRLGEPAHRGQRRAQLVRDRQQELALPGLAAGQRVGEVVDRPRDLGHLGGPLHRHPHVAPAGAQQVGRGGGAAQRPGQQRADDQPRPPAPPPRPRAARSRGCGGSGRCRAGPCPTVRTSANAPVAAGPGLDHVRPGRDVDARRDRGARQRPVGVRLGQRRWRPRPCRCGPGRAARCRHPGSAASARACAKPRPRAAVRVPDQRRVGELSGDDVRLLGEDVLGDLAGGLRRPAAAPTAAATTTATSATARQLAATRHASDRRLTAGPPRSRRPAPCGWGWPTPSLARSWATWTSTVRVPADAVYPHTADSSCSRVNTRPGSRA